MQARWKEYEARFRLKPKADANTFLLVLAEDPAVVEAYYQQLASKRAQQGMDDLHVFSAEDQGGEMDTRLTDILTRGMAARRELEARLRKQRTVTQ